MIDRDNKQEWDFFSTALIEEARTAIWETQARVEPRDLIQSVISELQEIATETRYSETHSEQMVWKKVRETLVKGAYNTRPYCIKCGTCCKKETPTLLMQDMVLLRREIILPEHLYTIRTGEVAYSPVHDTATELDREIIKVRGTDGTKQCMFFRGIDGLCSIYENRPLQCQLQECWNPAKSSQLSAVYMTRSHIFKSVEALWNIISAHEDRCSLDKWTKAMRQLEATRGHSVEEVLEMLRYDHTVRQFVSTTFSMKSNIIDLVLGRPLKDFLHLYGLRLLESLDGMFVLQPRGKEN